MFVIDEDSGECRDDSVYSWYIADVDIQISYRYDER
jgi:hypothetical protein